LRIASYISSTWGHISAFWSCVEKTSAIFLIALALDTAPVRSLLPLFDAEHVFRWDQFPVLRVSCRDDRLADLCDMPMSFSECPLAAACSDRRLLTLVPHFDSNANYISLQQKIA
jgi:hypothetical protein